MESVGLFTTMSPPETDDPFKEYQEKLGKNYKLVDVEPPDENGEYTEGNVGVIYYSLYAINGGVKFDNIRYYRLMEENIDTIYGSFYEKDGMVYSTQHQWKWVKDKKAYNEKLGQEELKQKEPKDMEAFFKVMKEIDIKEFNHLWGLNLERL